MNDDKNKSKEVTILSIDLLRSLWLLQLVFRKYFLMFYPKMNNHE